MTFRFKKLSFLGILLCVMFMALGSDFTEQRAVQFKELKERADRARNSDHKELWNSTLDSIRFYLNQTPSDEWELRWLLERASYGLKYGDASEVKKLFSEASQLAEHLEENNSLRVKLKMRSAAYSMIWGEASADSVLNIYLELLPLITHAEDYTLKTELFGRISLNYSTSGNLVQALEYNKWEIENADLSKDGVEMAKARITELNLGYQLIPKPITPEEVKPLITKGEKLMELMRVNEIEDILPFAKLFLAKFYVYALDYPKGLALLNSINDSSYGLNVRFSKYEQLCDVARSQKDLESYQRYLLKFKPIAYQTKRQFVELNVHNHLLHYFLLSHEADSASFYARKLEGNLSKVDTTRFLDYLLVSYQELANFYHEHDPKKEALYRKYTDNINKQIISQQKQVMKKVLTYQAEADKLKEENEELANSMLSSRTNIILLIALSLSLVTLMILGIKKFSKSQKAVIALKQEKKSIEQKVERKSLLLNNKNRLYLDTILYLKADGNYVDFYTTEKNYTDRNRLSLVLDKLPPNFVRVHRSYVINKNYIQSHNSTTVFLTNEKEVPLSRTFKMNLS